MTFLQNNLITFRGADISAVHASYQSKGIEVVGSPEPYTAEKMGSDGMHWNTRDPDGNVVYFDTMAEEAPKSRKVERLLDDIERYLAKAGIESTTFAAFRAELTDRYLSEEP